MADLELNPPPPGPVGPTQLWVAIVGAIFGGITLIGLFVFAFIAGREPAFICNSFTLLAAIFAFGAALAAGFIGGAAGVNGRIPFVKDNIIVFSAAGGIAVFFIAFLVFQSYGTSVCDPIYEKLKKENAQLQLDKFELARQMTDLIGQTNAAKKEPFIFWAENVDSALQNIVMKYMTGSGEYRKVKPQGHQFKIERGDIGDLNEGFSLETDLPEPLSKRPIALQRIVPKASPWQMSLFLNLPSAGERPE
jgi:hypothetical protein